MQKEPRDDEVPVCRKESTCYNVFCWVFQILTWITFPIALTVSLNSGNGYHFIYFGFIYYLYIVLEFCSLTAKLLYYKNKKDVIYEKMGRLFQTPPKISLYCECYFSFRGNRNRLYKEYQHIEEYFIPYYSARDVSGLFSINEKDNGRKSYIKLELEAEIYFADEISYYDYMFQKKNFWDANKKKSPEFNFKEYRTIPNMEHYNLVPLDDNEPCLINFFFFFIFTICMFAEIYKIIFDCYCMELKFKVRKLVSTRYDLNQPKYEKLIPKLDIYDKQYTIDNYNYLIENYTVVSPTEEDLKKAEKFKDKIPDYKITSEEGNKKAGIVIDDPSYPIFKPSEEPIDIDSNVNVNQNQMNMNKNENRIVTSEQLIE